MLKLSLLIPLALTFASPALAGAYQSSCWDCELGGSLNNLLGCFCSASSGSYYSILDLNTCLANDGGQIGPRHDGEFAYTCSRDGDLGDGVSDPCWSCGDGVGGYQRSCPCLDCWISNRDGTLTCDY
ncbi:hypothetical protein L218DRAFT_675464 [Marasmius fiardii PR-910]|nr:hypothetical protein L218DRAFT_675464 [Marasmius fiardii PR-910]